MKKCFALCSVMLSIVSCTTFETKPQNKYLTYQNLVILSDLSSRIDNKPTKDLEEIHKIVQFFRNECVKPGEKIGDKSSITFSTFSKKISASVDMNQIKNVGEKQRFINSTKEYQDKGFDYKIQMFEEKVKTDYNNIRNQGLDLISFLKEKIENEPIVKTNITLSNGIDTTFVNYENHIYIFTDGYLEYVNRGPNDQYYFGKNEIEKVRQYCVANNMSIAKTLESNKSFCLPASISKNYKNLNLHVYETHERDKDDKLLKYNHPPGQRDNEILEAVWRKWASESGFQSFEWKKY